MPIRKAKRSKALVTAGRQNQHGDHGNQSPLYMTRLEKSRCAAKKRRDLEGEEMTNLIALLPFSDDVVSRLDKGSIFRLIIGYIQMKDFVQHELPVTMGTSVQDRSADRQTEWNAVVSREGGLMLEALDGFLVFLSKKGQILYASESIEKHTGIISADMIGKSINPFIHTDDQKELVKQFVLEISTTISQQQLSPREFTDDAMDVDGSNSDDPLSELFTNPQERHFYLRMKTFSKKKGSKTRQAGFVLFQWSGRLRLLPSNNPTGFSIEGLLCLCRPVEPVPLVEIRMDGNMFMSRHNLDLRFTFCDPRIVNLIGYEPSELIGKTAYQFHNPLDVFKIRSCHSNLIVKGTSVSKYYRFLGKENNWVWMQTRATIIYNTNNEPQYIVCMNYIIGEEEGRRYMMLEQEQEGAKAKSADIQGVMDTSSSVSSPEGATSSGYESIMETSDHEDVPLIASDDNSQDWTIGQNPQLPNQSVVSTPDQQNIETAEDFSQTPVSEGLSGFLNCQPNISTNGQILLDRPVKPEFIHSFNDPSKSPQSLSSVMDTMLEQVDPDSLLADPANVALPTEDGADILDGILDNSVAADLPDVGTEITRFPDHSPSSGYTDSFIATKKLSIHSSAMSTEPIYSSCEDNAGLVAPTPPPSQGWNSTDSGAIVDSLIDSVLLPPLISDLSSVNGQGSLRMQMGMLNPADFPASAVSPNNSEGQYSQDFPDDLIKLAVQFCEGLADEVMADTYMSQTLDPAKNNSSNSFLLQELSNDQNPPHVSELSSQAPDGNQFIQSPQTSYSNQVLQQPEMPQTQGCSKAIFNGHAPQKSAMSQANNGSRQDSNSFIVCTPADGLDSQSVEEDSMPHNKTPGNRSHRPMSELEKQLRTIDDDKPNVPLKADKMAYKISRLDLNEIKTNQNSNSILHQLLIGEMSKDMYTEMEHKPKHRSHPGRLL